MLLKLRSLLSYWHLYFAITKSIDAAGQYQIADTIHR